MEDKPTYFGSLLHQKDKGKPLEMSEEHMLRENERNFIEGTAISTEGPLKYMSADVLDLIHQEIDERMQEL